MKKRIIKYIILIFFVLNQQVVFATTVDNFSSDTTQVKENVIKKVEAETSVMKNYFSFTKVLITIILLTLTFFFLKVVSAILSAWSEKNTKHRIVIKGLIPITRIIVWFGTFTFILVAVFRPPLASILAFAASIGVAVGFAAQDLLKNIFGGIAIIIDNPFQIGDKVEIGNHYGEVVSIGLRSTRIVTPDDSVVSVPNSAIMSQPVSNANVSEENCQVSTEIFLPLTANMEVVKQRALEAAKVSKYIFLNKPIVVLFSQENFANMVMLKVKVKAYVNDIRNEFIFKSEITQILTKEFSNYYIK